MIFIPLPNKENPVCVVNIEDITSLLVDSDNEQYYVYAMLNTSDEDTFTISGPFQDEEDAKTELGIIYSNMADAIGNRF